MSASSGKRRKDYQRLLGDIRDGQYDVVIAYDADRLHRQPRELEDFIDLADAHKLILATVGGDFDLSTPTGRGNARMKGVFARMEMEQKGARQRSAAQQKAAQGRPHWSRAFGYIDDTHEPDPHIAPLVEQAYAAIIAGASLNDVCRLWNDAGALTQRYVKRRDEKKNLVFDPATNKPIIDIGRRPWTHSQVSNFLRKPRNAALRDYNDELVFDDDHEPVKGNWPAVVDEKTWRAAQTVLRAGARTRKEVCATSSADTCSALRQARLRRLPLWYADTRQANRVPVQNVSRLLDSRSSHRTDADRSYRPATRTR
jgi:DNA invertase Pin-like site-specific DNA recombinase